MRDRVVGRHVVRKGVGIEGLEPLAGGDPDGGGEIPIVDHEADDRAHRDPNGLIAVEITTKPSPAKG